MARLPNIPDNVQVVLTDGTKAVPLEALPPEAWTFITGDGVEVGALKTVMEKVPWLGRGVRLLGTGITKVPFSIMQGDDEIDQSEDYQNAIGWLPDPFKLLRQIEMDLAIHARAYVFKDRNIVGRFRAEGVRRLYPPTIRNRVDSERGLYGFIRTINGRQLPPLKREDLAYIALDDVWSEEGRAISPALNALGAANVLMNMDEFIDAYFKRGAVKITLLMVSGSSSEQQRQELERWWQKILSGVRNAWRGRVLNADRVEAVPIGEGMAELGDETLTKTKREDISTALGIPQSILFSTGAVNRAVSQQDDINFYDKTIIPDSQLIAMALNEQLFGPEGYRIRLNPQQMSIFQEDEAVRSQAVWNLVNAGEQLDVAYDILGVEMSDEMREKRVELQQQQQEAALERQRMFGLSRRRERVNGREPSDEEKMLVDLDKWLRKSLRLIKRGIGGACDFDSDFIPKPLNAAIRAQLDHAETEEEVRGIFEGVKAWGNYPGPQPLGGSNQDVDFHQLSKMLLLKMLKDGEVEVEA